MSNLARIVILSVLTIALLPFSDHGLAFATPLVAVSTTSSSPQAIFSSTNPSGGRTECRANGLNIHCAKNGYEEDTLTVRNKLACYDGSHCPAVYYNIAVNYGRCNRALKNVKNYGNRFLRPHEAYSYYFSNANRNRCMEYVVHTCTMHTSNSRPVDCSTVFDITTY